MRTIIALLVSIIVVSSALAQSKDMSYLCITEFAGGVAYNSSSKKWEGVAFRSDRKFVVRLKFVEGDTQVGKGGRLKRINSYTGTITNIGGGGGRETCIKFGNSEPAIINLQEQGLIANDEDISFRCVTGSYDYTVNVKTKRFMSVLFSSGYVEGKDSSDEATPVISGGTCTKFD